jgi:hypothetical protein
MEAGSGKDNRETNLVEIYQVKVMRCFPDQRQMLAFCYVSKARIADDCHGAVRSDMMFLHSCSCLMHQVTSLNYLCESRQGGV